MNAVKTMVTIILIATSLVIASQNQKELLERLRSQQQYEAQIGKDIQDRAHIQRAQMDSEHISASSQMHMSHLNAGAARRHNDRLHIDSLLSKK